VAVVVFAVSIDIRIPMLIPSDKAILGRGLWGIVGEATKRGSRVTIFFWDANIVLILVLAVVLRPDLKPSSLGVMQHLKLLGELLNELSFHFGPSRRNRGVCVISRWAIRIPCGGRAKNIGVESRSLHD